MKYFTIEELCHSDTAKAKGIDNNIPEHLKQNLVDLCDNVLDIIREEYGDPIKINCGYRSQTLNKEVGGASTSDHLLGRAADIANNAKLQQLILRMAKNKEFDFDQIIIEKPNAAGVGTWIHIGYRQNANRHQTLIFKNDKYISFNI